MIRTTLSSAVEEQSYSIPGTLMTAGPRGAVAPVYTLAQKPQKKTVEGTRDAVGEEKFRLLF